MVLKFKIPIFITPFIPILEAIITKTHTPMKFLSSFVLLFLYSLSLFSQSDKEKVAATVNKSSIEGHIYFLSDDLLKGRETGTPEIKIAAAYLANTLRGYGIKPSPVTGSYYQAVPLDKKSPPGVLTLELDGEAIEQLAPLDALPMEYIGEALYLGYGLESDYTGKEVAGKLVVVRGGSETAQDARGAFRLRATKTALAKEHGVLGIIELLDTEDTMWGYIEHNFNTAQYSIPKGPGEEAPDEPNFTYLWLKDSGGERANTLSARESLPVRLSCGGYRMESVTSQNVIGVVEGSDPKLKEEFIIYSAHYDHVGIGTPDASGDTIYNGARDNSVGTTTVLSMAENLARYPTKRSALFILFTAEEKGLLGSKYYVENPVIPLDQTVYCFNSDNAGYNNTELATIIGLTRTTAEKNIREAVAAFGLKAIDDPAPEQGLFDRSDNVHFAAKGIPAPTFCMGFDAFDGDVTKYYHRPGDEADTLDFNYLEQFFRAYVLAGRLLANDPVKPFWVAGDTYEAAGKALYQN